jgi:2,5-diketo-D-gluconate reductase A
MSSELNKDSSVPFVHGNHSSIPLLGFGTYLSSQEEAESSVLHALNAGFRHIDTAEFYNNRIAAAIQKSGLRREDIFITDKLNPGGIYGAKQKTYEDTQNLVLHHLTRLQTSYIDLFILHHAFAKEERLQQYQALLDLQKEGFIREVGVSNWNIHHLQELQTAQLPVPSANQIEIHPLCTQESLMKYCREQGIVPIAYSSLAPLSTWRIEPGQNSLKLQVLQGEENEQQLAFNQAFQKIQIFLQELQQKYSKSSAQILLRWALQHRYPILPKSIKQERILENADLFDFMLEENDMNTLDSFDINIPFAWQRGNPLDCP